MTDDVEDNQVGGPSNTTSLLSECTICMNRLRFEPSDSPNSSSIRTFYYFQTPCGHKFHQRCLLNWMQVKLECPVCREELPALDDN